MRVLIFAPNYLPATRYGGPVRSTHGLARGLAGQGHEVHVLTTDVDGSGRLDVPLDRPVEMDGVHVHYRPIIPPRRIYFSPALARLADEMVPYMDVVHVNGMFLWPGPRIARAARRAGVALVVSPRGMLMPEMIAGKSRLVKQAWIRAFERANLAGARAIHLTSAGEAEGLRKTGLDLAPCMVIGNGVDAPDPAPTPAEIAAVWGDVPAGRRVAFLARLDWTKGVDLAIDAARACPEVYLRIAGYDQIGLREALLPRTRRSDGSRCAEFVGPLDGRAKWAFLAGADMLLAPSVRESFGMSVAEALAVGTPAIVTPGVGIRTILAELDPELVEERTEEALAESLLEWMRNGPRRKAVGQRAASVMADRHGWHAAAQRMVSLYRGEPE
ncbi:Glycogen synthase [Roseivivax jejudonensis]|uniref:Glycogen synthase n=1 Tax=Roseivivax jejudonensis TaxID=1529041 RepID=A0A1X6Y5L0_9RHOB|nr:glycosyltransferase [Roseivivax jejudonensis]SLN11627.1 Glycogen synthase [Roseivivax jejudonensis]